MRNWGQGVQKRREDFVRAIRSGNNETGPARIYGGAPIWKKEEHQKDNLPWNPPTRNQDKRKKTRQERFFIQFFLSFLLFTGTYLVFQSQVPIGQEAQGHIKQVLEKEFNFAGVAQWYQKTVGTAPAILPAFHHDGKKEKTTSWLMPVSGKRATDFTPEKRGITVTAPPASPVVASGEGWVIQVGEEEGVGNTVILRHKDNRETWYGGLASIKVKENDWVQARQLLGEVGEEASLFFAMKEGGVFMDPVGVIPFE